MARLWLASTQWTFLQVLKNKSSILSLEVTKSSIYWKDNSATMTEKLSGGVKVIGGKKKKKKPKKTLEIN